MLLSGQKDDAARERLRDALWTPPPDAERDEQHVGPQRRTIADLEAMAQALNDG